MRTDNEDVLEYYKRELTYLRRMGMAFADQYPKVAGRLELSPDQCPDPHIERLIESFAFLTARIQYNIESEFPRLSMALLEALYPQLVSPTPSMTIAQFEVDPSQGKLTSGHIIEKGSQLFATTLQGQTCRFRTCYPVNLLPLKVSWAGLESKDKYDFLDYYPDVAMVIRVRLESMAGSLEELDFNSLRFFLNGDYGVVNTLYEVFFNHILKVGILPENASKPIYLQPSQAILPVGFTKEEDVLPYPSNAHYGYRLLHEYFTFPEKFFFMDVEGLKAHRSEEHFDILFLSDQRLDPRSAVDASTFQLGCTPIINLFHKTSDPVRLDHRRAEYRINPDKRREKTTEIHSILSVSSSTDPREVSQNIQPYFSFTHDLEKRGQSLFFHARRQNTNRRDLPGTEMLLSFVDLDFNPRIPSESTVYAHVACTNRGLAEELPLGALLTLDQAAPLAHIAALKKPTGQISPPMDGAVLWRLVSHLSLNHLSLDGSEEGLKALQEIMRLYCFSVQAEVHNRISGVRNMATQQSVRRVGAEGWRGFCRGRQIILEFDEQLYEGSGAFLMASVLNRFFPLFASINSFTQLDITSKQREGVWKRWPPMIGEKAML